MTFSTHILTPSKPAMVKGVTLSYQADALPLHHPLSRMKEPFLQLVDKRNIGCSSHSIYHSCYTYWTVPSLPVNGRLPFSFVAPILHVQKMSVLKNLVCKNLAWSWALTLTILRRTASNAFRLFIR